ncbi:MAG: N-6 DNA methylase [Anaerolineales bacterium]|nr:N-6 DNA methylase [Anaerolineales bacterium]
MLDSETKRRIDTARDILVGKVPDPKSQVEQITIALIYKFMDDMDAEAEELGGVRSFFVGEYEKFSWAKLLSPALGGYEMLSLYTEAVEKMTRNEGVPQLFRDIFKNAYLPYRDPETLKLFLKTINEFTYDHSERLGDAFEYLLSVLGSQGEAGQFRTPRHIIEFMVKVVDPQKVDSILDPACGTAGYLISAYKHVLATNARDDKPGAALSPEERTRLANNIRGYDISPDMVRLSLVNLYLHGFSTPNIYEYDTLTSEERWNEYADVILANPPFMSPKGGIKPHKRFSVQSNRSEVLFVDYMAEHLTPNGRAAIIVPEGIIFQSAGAYKQLRKYLIEQDYLWAVVSLPAGVFNPYAGVKTSILFLDKSLAKKTDQVLFVKVDQDGYDLGAQRRPIDRNDLPDALHILNSWKHVVASGEDNDMSLRAHVAKQSPENGESASSEEAPASESRRTLAGQRHNQGDVVASPVGAKQSPHSQEIASSGKAPSSQRHYGSEGVASSLENAPRNDMYLLVSTSRLAENGDYNLSADRYRDVTRNHHKDYPMVALGDERYFIIESGGTPDSKNEDYWNGDVYWATLVDLPADDHISIITNTQRKITQKGLNNSSAKIVPPNSVIVSSRATIGRVGMNKVPLATNQGFKNIVIADRNLVDAMFVAFMVKKLVPEMEALASGGTFKEISKTNFSKLQIPLPPLEIQRQIVDEIAAHQRIIDGARQVVEGWKPDIELELEEFLPEGVTEWEVVRLGDAKIEIIDGDRGVNYPKKEDFSPTGYCLFLNTSNVRNGDFNFDNLQFIPKAKEDKLRKGRLQRNDIVLTTRGTVGNIALYDE